MRIDERGWLGIDGASLSSHIALSRALVGRKAGWLDMIEKGMPAAWLEGPQIESVPYPTALVARAANDGGVLEAVLRPTNGGARIDVALSQLVPRSRYDVTGAVEPTLTADEGGNASVQVDLDGRRELRVVPTA
jgi:hypothetical protein